MMQKMMMMVTLTMTIMVMVMVMMMIMMVLMVMMIIYLEDLWRVGWAHGDAVSETSTRASVWVLCRIGRSRSVRGGRLVGRLGWAARWSGGWWGCVASWEG